MTGTHAIYRTTTIAHPLFRKPSWDEAKRMFDIAKMADWDSNAFGHLHEAAASLGIKRRDIGKEGQLPPDVYRIKVYVKSRVVESYMLR